MMRVVGVGVVFGVVVGVMILTDVVGAAEVPAVKNDTYVYDEAEVIDEGVEVELNGLLRSLEEDTSAELFVVTVNGLGGEAIEEFGYRVGNGMGIGQAEYDNGLLLLVSPPEGVRNVRIEVGRGMEGIFNDAKVGRILDEDFVPYREKGNYQEGIRQTIVRLVGETRDNAEWVGKDSMNEDWVVIGFFGVVGVVILGILLFGIYMEGRQNRARKGRSNAGFWATMAIGFAVIRERNRSEGLIGGIWKVGGGGGGFGGGGSGGGSFGGGGATR